MPERINNNFFMVVCFTRSLRGCYYLIDSARQDAASVQNRDRNFKLTYKAFLGTGKKERIEWCKRMTLKLFPHE